MRKNSAAPSSGSESGGEITLYLMRHGKTMLNTTNRVQGWSDSVLTPDGEEVVRYAGKGLKDVEFVAAYSSDSGRAIQTANIIMGENKSDMALVTDPRLREFNFGTYEGDLSVKMQRNISERLGKTLSELIDTGISLEDFANSLADLDKENVKKDGLNWPAEDYQSIVTRLTNAINDIAKKESTKGEGNVLIVSHGLSILAIIDSLFGKVENPLKGLSNAGVSKITYKNGTFTLDTIDNTNHIEKAKQKNNKMPVVE